MTKLQYTAHPLVHTHPC